MEVFKSLDQIKVNQPMVIALGNFDGVHRGHRELIERAVKSSEIASLKSGVFTFSNHPRNLLKGNSGVKNILYEKDKIQLIGELGVDYLFNIPFSDQLAQLSPEEFIHELLIGRLHMKEAYCGFNYRFGHQARGTVETLTMESMKEGVGIHILEPFEIDGQIVSSTLIRSMIQGGEMEQCRRYLGRVYSIAGKVVVGNRLGKTIGFPTSNLHIDPGMVSPKNGVYFTDCLYNGVRYASITNVGNKPTIGTYHKNVETHIFNFNKELYGKDIRVEFLKKSRDEVKFSSVKELSQAITKDCIAAKAYHQSRGAFPVK